MQEILRFLKKQNRLTKVIFGTVIMIGLVLYSLLGIIYKNYNINKQSQDNINEINRLSQDNLDQQSKILYYSTNAYAEKVLREKLGYQKEGERVYALPRTDPEREKLIAEQKKFQETQDKKPNPLKWFEFFFTDKNDITATIQNLSNPTQVGN
ncbi:MAG TPA: septum formation initiator family protein [Patescibacteria group bacterium]|nr:septum formation initiator family protein [Patescibacteria group bacterium]